MRVFIKQNRGMLVGLNVQDISSIQAMSRYIIITMNDKKTYTVLCQLNEFMKKIPAYEFCRVHHSYVVRIDLIGNIFTDYVVMSNKLEVNMSREGKKELLSKITILQ